MEKEIDVLIALRGTPRPHYLFGKATYEQEDNIHILRGNINFTSTDEHPSIADRAGKYLPHPHVNAGDVCFAVWNGAHIIADIQGYSERTLINEIKVFPKKLVPPDTTLSLEVRATEKERKTDRKKRKYEIGSIEGRISLNGELLTEVHADYFVRK